PNATRRRPTLQRSASTRAFRRRATASSTMPTSTVAAPAQIHQVSRATTRCTPESPDTWWPADVRAPSTTPAELAPLSEVSASGSCGAPTTIFTGATTVPGGCPASTASVTTSATAAPVASDGIVGQVTVWPATVQPLADESKCTPDGSVAVTAIPVAVAGPRF